MATSIQIAARSSSGIHFSQGPPNIGDDPNCPPIVSKSCRTMLFSPDGQHFAFTDGSQIRIMQTEPWKEVAVIEGSKAYHLAFSPLGTYLMSWEVCITNSANPQGTPNLHIYKRENGQLLKSFIHKKQVNWEPQWSADEKLFCKLQNTDIVFYEDLNFERIVTRLNSFKVLSYQLSPNVGTFYFLCHTPGSPGQPSFGRLFKYPNVEGSQAIVSKSFFNADKLEVKWNAKGNNALLLTSTDVDKTGTSYYGKQGLHFMGLNAQTSFVSLSKEGPIYSVEWSPKNQEFCVVYGFTPAKATIFNLKCEPVFELGTGARNSIYYNPHGNILLLGGFGNLRGNIETWDAINRKKISTFDAPDTTLLSWAADGEHILTATTAPRLRISNGFKIWHYTGSLLYEKNWVANEELYEVAWRVYPKQAFKEPTITTKKVEGIAPSQPQASAQAYRPPSARNKPHVSFSLHDDEESPHKPGGDSTQSKASLKLKKKREAKKAKQKEEGDESNGPAIVSSVQVTMTGDVEVDKKLKAIKKKLDAIEKLKGLQAQGKTLEINQLAKIKGEADLLKELQQLQL